MPARLALVAPPSVHVLESYKASVQPGWTCDQGIEATGRLRPDGPTAGTVAADVNMTGAFGAPAGGRVVGGTVDDDVVVCGTVDEVGGGAVDDVVAPPPADVLVGCPTAAGLPHPVSRAAMPTHAPSRLERRFSADTPAVISDPFDILTAHRHD